MKTNFGGFRYGLWGLILVFSLMMSSSCRWGFNTNQKADNSNANNVPQPTPTVPKLNLDKGNKFPSLSFQSWHQSKPGMILKQSDNKFYYLKSPGEMPVDFNDYRTAPSDKLIEHKSHSGKFMVNIKTDRKVRYTSCCAIQEYSYEIILSEVNAPDNQTVLDEGLGKDIDFRGWSPDDKFVLIDAGRELFLFDVATKEKISIPPGNGETQTIFAPNGKGVFIAGYGAIQYFDLAARQLTDVFRSAESHPKMSISPSGKKLILLFDHQTDDQNHVYLFDPEKLTKINEYNLPNGFIDSFEGWKAGEKELAFSISGKDYVHDIYSINLQNGQLIHWYPPKDKTTGTTK